MAAGRNNTQRIENLENLAATLASRLSVQDILVKGLDELLKKGTATTEGHVTRITVIEERLSAVDLTGLKVGEVDKQLVAIKKDLEALGKWKDDLKKENEERARRVWAFGPSLSAALIGGLITLAGIGVNVWLTYQIKVKP